MKQENTNAARYAKINHKIYLAILKIYQREIMQNAIIMSEDDKELLIALATDYTAFMHSEKFDVNELSERREKLFPL